MTVVSRITFHLCLTKNKHAGLKEDEGSVYRKKPVIYVLLRYTGETHTVLNKLNPDLPISTKKC